MKLRTLFAVSLFAVASDALRAQETGMDGAPFFSFVGRGADFVQVSTTTRTSWSGPCPIDVEMPALPPGAVPVRSVLCANFLANDVPPAHQVTLNGTPIRMTKRGEGKDLCWNKDFGVSYISDIDVTPHLNFGAANSLGGVCDGPLGADLNALGEGVTILTVYEVPFGQPRFVNVFCGYTASEVNDFVANGTLEFSHVYAGGPFRLFLNAMDGQAAFRDEFFINGIVAGGVVPGTATATNAWQGVLGPFSHSNLYDAADGDIASFVPINSTSLTFETVRTQSNVDCIGHSLAAVAFGSVFDTNF